MLFCETLRASIFTENMYVDTTTCVGHITLIQEPHYNNDIVLQGELLIIIRACCFSGDTDWYIYIFVYFFNELMRFAQSNVSDAPDR